MTPKDYWQALGDRQLQPTALRVALIVGTILFCINHGSAVFNGEMSRNRWISAILTYIVPYCVNIHGQASTRYKTKQQSIEQQLTTLSR